MYRAILLGLLLLTNTAEAQPAKFGEISKGNLVMEVYEKDSTASAVVLFSVGSSDLDYRNDQFYLTVTKHVRIKILTDEGLEEGDISIRYRNKESNNPQKVSNIKAASYVLSDNGEIIKEEVGRRDRFEEEISETVSEVKFTIPGLQKGAIFEYSYELVSNNPLDFPDWLFQDDIPVLWSEYNARIPEWFNFLTVTKGFEVFYINEQNSYNDRIIIMGNGGSDRIDYSGTEYRYVMKDLPAIKDEPYMKASIDYLSHVRYQLSSIQMPYSSPTYYLKSWTETVNEMHEDEDFGKRLESSDVLIDAAKVAIDGAESDLDKLISVYNHVANTMEWNEEYGLWSFEDLDEKYEEGVANGTTINLILTQMLREAGLVAYPMIISTRTNGEIIRLFPSPNQFNHTVVYAEVDGRYYLLDAKNEYRPYNFLPAENLNGEGLIILENQEYWIPLQNIVPNSNRSIVRVEISDEGYSGEINSSSSGFYALNARNDLDLNELEESIETEVFKVQGDFTVDSAAITKDKLDDSFDFFASFSSEDESAVNVRYFNPMLLGRIDENPFKLDNRNFPVDFDFTFGENLVMNIFVPQGWEVDEIPQSVLHRLPEQAGEFRRIAQQNGNMISLNYLFKVNKTRFMPEEYQVVKAMYDQMVTMLSENIVLKKVAQ